MKGDFSKWKFDPYANDTGVLHQQGRVLLDQDWNAGASISGYLRQMQGGDTIGRQVAAVPAEAADSFRVIEADCDGNSSHVTLHPGRVWVDGWLLQIAGDAPYQRAIEYFPPPVQDPLADLSSLAAGVRDAVVLDVWEQSLSAFQDPVHLLEPALGGVDTSQRARLFYDLKLLRLEPGDDCCNLATALTDDLTARGKLTVTPAPTLAITGPCPVALGGGYAGLEHYLFRVEIAEPDGEGQARFKWSRFNGALVGRGAFDAAAGTLDITANDQMINHSGLSSFYLEALAEDPQGGRWGVRFSADATLAADGQLALTNVQGAWPGGAGGDAFFRLWDGVSRIADFPDGSSTPQELVAGLGIRLAFDAPATGNANYVPEDYWTFPVRTAGTEGFDPAEHWPNAAPPHGIQHHRAPLAILRWQGPAGTIQAPAQIDDCRRRFAPLTGIRQGCCLSVAPGEDLHAAMAKLAGAGGGCLCLLPGEHRLTRPLDLSGLSGLRLHGSGMSSRLVIAADIGAAAFDLARTHDLSFESLAVTSDAGVPIWSCGATTDLRLRNLFVYSRISRGLHEVISNTGPAGSRWTLEDCVFIGPTGLGGTSLLQSRIRGCDWFGLESGIALQHLLEVEIRSNRWFGIAEQDLKDLENLADRLNTEALAEGNVYEMLLDLLLRQTTATIGSRYTAIDVSGALDVQVLGNSMGGRAGLYCEIVENGIVRENEFSTTVFGATLGLVRGLQFCDNRIGTRPAGQTQGIRCQTGLRILSEALDCRIADNRFDNVRQGVVFESDAGGEKETIRDFSVKLQAAQPADPQATANLLAAAQSQTKAAKTKQVLLSSTFFAFGKCERVVVEGNTFRADAVGVEWSGTKNIVDFRVTGNAFLDCQEAAIQIEPEDFVFLLAEPVETRVRLIENNRFEVYGPAVRSTLGGVRVERNDIRVKQPARQLAAWKAIGSVMSETVFVSAALSQSITDQDVPGFRLLAKNEIAKAESNPAAIDGKAFSQAASDRIVSAHPPFAGDTAADSVFVMKSLADSGALALLVNVATLDWFRGNVRQEGFAINLGGRQNRVRENQLYSANPQMDGGVVFHLLSGEATGNEIAVHRVGLMMHAKAGQSRENIRIAGNRLTVFGPASSGGKSEPAYALALPTLRPCNLSILDNLFEGSVMIGAEPFASLGLKADTAVFTSSIAKFYNAVKMDSGSYSYAVASQAKLGQAIAPTFVDPAIVSGLVLQLWIQDPHRERPVVQFADNRVARGWVAIAQSTGGAFWTQATLENQTQQALVLNLSGNVFDYWARVVGRELIIANNHSQMAIQYRSGLPPQIVANLPAPQPF